MIEAWKEHINHSIEKALKHESFIDKEILDIRGFSTGVMRRLISNICHFQKENLTYLEVGLYGGATFCSAINNNPKIRAIGVEDFSQTFEDGAVEKHLRGNLEKFSNGNFQLIEKDFFSVSPDQLVGGIDVFFYDGEHSYYPQFDALPHAFLSLADEFVFIVDDYDWEVVHEGTKNSVNKLILEPKMECIKEWHLTDYKPDGETWHNGLGILLCQKTA